MVHASIVSAILWWSIAVVVNATWHPLRRKAHPVRTFDKSVLGNLKTVDEMALSHLPRNHVFDAEITMGTPPQTFTCLIDSGTADLWIPSRQCTDCRNEHHFHAERSSTFMAAHRYAMGPIPKEEHSGGGAVIGFLAQDTMHIGNVELKNQSFLIVEGEKMPRKRDWDGVCGLGWKEFDTTGVPLYRNMQKQGHPALFSLVPTSQVDTFLVVGELPKASEFGDWAWADAEDPGGRGFWIANGGLGTRSSKPMKARLLIDSGTPFLHAPRRVYAHFVRSLFPRDAFNKHCGADQAAGNLVVCDCAIASLTAGIQEKLRVYLGGKVFSLEVTDLFKRVPTSDGTGELCLLQVQPSAPTFDPLKLLAGLLGAPVVPNGKDGKAHPEGMLLPLLLPPGLLVPPGTKGALPPGGDEVEEQLRMMPDGSRCKTVLVWRHGHLKSNKTSCTPSDHSEQRRLQGLLLATPVDDMDDVWVLGGVFLERVITVLDFDNKKIGFCRTQLTAQAPQWREPATGAARQVLQGVAAPHMDNTHNSQSRQNTKDASPGFPWGMTFFLVCLISMVVFGVGFFQKMRRPKNISDQVPEELEKEPTFDQQAAEEDPDADADAAE